MTKNESHVSRLYFSSLHVSCALYPAIVYYTANLSHLSPQTERQKLFSFPLISRQWVVIIIGKYFIQMACGNSSQVHLEYYSIQSYNIYTCMHGSTRPRGNFLHSSQCRSISLWLTCLLTRVRRVLCMYVAFSSCYIFWHATPSPLSSLSLHFLGHINITP